MGECRIIVCRCRLVGVALMEFGRGTLIMHAFWWVWWFYVLVWGCDYGPVVGNCWLGIVRVDLIWSDLPAQLQCTWTDFENSIFSRRNGTGKGILPWSTSGHGILLVLFFKSVLPSLPCQDVIREESKLYSHKHILFSRSNFESLIANSRHLYKENPQIYAADITSIVMELQKGILKCLIAFKGLWVSDGSNAGSMVLVFATARTSTPSPH